MERRQMAAAEIGGLSQAEQFQAGQELFDAGDPAAALMYLQTVESHRCA